MRRASSLALAFALGSRALAAQQPADPARQLDTYTAQAVKDWNAVGLAISVVKDGRLVFAKGYGSRELGKPEMVDSATLFAIGSTTKAMTAAAIGMLVDEGKVRWDDPVTNYLPNLQLRDPYATREITVRDLLTHRAGLPNADYLWYGTDNSTAEILRRVRYVEPAYSIRSSFIYQNVMYAAAGQVIAAASGMPWEEFVRTRIFAPLHMERTVPLLSRAARMPNVASPHDRIDDTMRVITNASVDPVASAGSVWSSVADMSKWMRFILDSGRVDGKALLKPATFAELLEPQTMVPPGQFYPSARLTKPHWMTYGLGWFQQDYDGRAVDFHTGSIDGMVAIIGLIPDERLGVYVLANADHVELRHALMLKVFDLWGPPKAKPRDWSAELRTLYGNQRTAAVAAAKAAEAKRVTGTKPSLPVARYAGVYADSLYGEASVRSGADGALRLRIGTLEGTLEHWQYDTFRVRWDRRWVGNELVTFVLGADGTPSRIEIDGRTFGRTDRGR
ncbi:MAG TPA: serine hydrolase [Gemmatimonadaceae bacterium]|nr:serine hydrolase [Gemmatimonadaceae bacterium]